MRGEEILPIPSIKASSVGPVLGCDEFFADPTTAVGCAYTEALQQNKEKL
jgi:hypothetical protein